MDQLKGVGVALVTPFHEDLTIDFDGLTALVSHVIAQGVDYIVMLGTTAESATLTASEKQAVIAHIKHEVSGQIPLVLGLGGNNTATVVDELQQLETDEISAILSVSPYYNRPTQEGIYRHYAAIAQASPLPVIMYNVPSRTGSNMEASTSLRLAKDFDNIIGIKEAAGDMTQVLRLLRDRPNDFLVISGDDMLALPLVSAGGDGVISVIGQGPTQHFCQMMQYAREGAFAKAYTLQFQLMPLIDAIFAEGNPAGIKAVLASMGICTSKVRLPLVAASDPLKEALKHYLSQINR
ncbi:MAG: 4-hydroxy-tetrahydrodipicolinate synthase [Dokdonia sp.]|jgi:4-hydroxy-tetrahydrodipicolinate synthase